MAVCKTYKLRAIAEPDYAAAVTRDRLYINGGNITVASRDTTSEMNEDIPLNQTHFLDLSKDWHDSTVVFSTIDKPPGFSHRGHVPLWYDDESNMLSAIVLEVSEPGAFGRIVPTSVFGVWSLRPDEAGLGIWNKSVSLYSSFSTSRLSLGDETAAQGPNGGWFLPPTNTRANQHFLELNLNSLNLTNWNTTGDLPDVSLGAMQYVPLWGSKGLLIMIGGWAMPSNPPDPNIINIKSVFVFDIGTLRWHRQNTTGDAPKQRTSHCMAGKSSTNQSFEIFVYGGNPGWTGQKLDSIDILTLPGFSWVNVPYEPPMNRSGHTCHSVAGGQILVVGGQNGSNNNEGPNRRLLNIFDLSKLQWADHFSASAPPYEQCDKVKQFYSQSDGTYFSHLGPDIAKLMGPPPPRNTTESQNRTEPLTADPPLPKEDPDSSEIRIPLIVGPTIGAVALLSSVAVTLLVIRWRRKKRQGKKEFQPKELDGSRDKHNGIWIPELPETDRPPEMDEQGFLELNEDTLREIGDDALHGGNNRDPAEWPGPDIHEVQGPEIHELPGHDFGELAADAPRPTGKRKPTTIVRLIDDLPPLEVQETERPPLRGKRKSSRSSSSTRKTPSNHEPKEHDLPQKNNETTPQWPERSASLQYQQHLQHENASLIKDP